MGGYIRAASIVQSFPATPEAHTHRGTVNGNKIEYSAEEIERRGLQTRKHLLMMEGTS